MSKPDNTSETDCQQLNKSNSSLSLKTLLLPTFSSSSIKNFKYKKQKPNIYFTTNEQQVISELQNALNVFEDESKLPITRTVSCVIEAFNVPSIYAKRIIKFCKNISAFKILGEPDQFAILKSFYLKFLMLRTSFMWNNEKNGYPVLENESGKNAVFMHYSFAASFKCQEIVNYNLKHTKELHTQLENDTIIIKLAYCARTFQTYS